MHRGSAVYSDKAMKHFKEIGTVIYLKLNYQRVKRRLGNLKARGVVLEEGQTLHDLYCERIPYYEKYADITIDEEGKTPGETVDELRDIIESMMDRSMVQRIVNEQKRILEEKDRILEEKDRMLQSYETESAALKAQLAQLSAVRQS